MTQWNPDCEDPTSCGCPGEEVTTQVKAKVILFKPDGKYYTEEEWRIPTREQVIAGGGTPGDSVGPYCMRFSPDFRRISGGPVLVETQEPWGYPHLLPVDGLQPDCPDHKLIQHRDRKPKWCNTCGRAAKGELIGQTKADRERDKRLAEVLSRHSLACTLCKDYIETGDPINQPTPLET